MATIVSSSEANYTCNTCGLSFGAAEFQRDHMKTEWHRYNLKRRVADLPPIPADVFAEKTLQMKQQQDEPPRNSNRQVTKKDLKRQEKEAKRQEQLRQKMAGVSLGRSDSMSSFSSVGFSAGEPSHDFISNSELSETTTDASDSEFDEPHSTTSAAPSTHGHSHGQDDVDQLLKEKLKTYVEIPPNVSFMDGHESDSTLDNVSYLSQKYGLVIPEEGHVSDWNGLISYLNEKVALGNVCLSCSYMGRSLAAVRAHMADKQHVKIPWDTEEEQDELLDFYDFEEFDDEEWEDVDDTGADSDTTEGTLDGEDGVLVNNGYELVLGASGKSAGHRSLQRYYKQRLSAPAETPGRRAVKLIDYRSPGITERAADKMVKQSWADQKKTERKWIRGAKKQNHQKHYRDQLLQ